MRTTPFWILLLLVAYAAIEGLSVLGLHLLANGIAGQKHVYYPADTLSDHHRQIITRLLREETDYNTYSPTLGWAIKPNGLSKIYPGRRQGEYQYQANSQGVRAERDYTLAPDRNTVRIATFGDSMTHGDNVGNPDTWQARMSFHKPDLEVINFGVGGYGLDQAYLRYLKDGVQFNPDIVFIGFMPENIRRNVNVFRAFYVPWGGQPLAKPRFAVEKGELRLLENPFSSLDDYQELLDRPEETLKRLGTHDSIYKIRYKAGPFDWSPTVRLLKLLAEKLPSRFIGDGIIDYDQYNLQSEAFEVTVALFDAFYLEATKNGSMPVIVILPNDYDLKVYLRDGIRRHHALIDHFESRNYRYVDLMSTLTGALEQGHEIRDIFFGHYSPMTNDMVANELLANLNNSGLLDRISNGKGNDQ